MAMSVQKVSVCPLKSAYAISTALVDGREQIVAATEGYGPALLVDPRTWTARELVPGPGGCMSLVQPPPANGSAGGGGGRKPGEESLFAIFGCFPGYKFQGAGVYRIHRSSAKAPFTSTEIFKLPFAHRICFVEKDGIEYLIAANLAANKTTPDDWSLPGALFAAPVPAKLSDDWEPVTIFENLHKNHCMYTGTLDGKKIMFIGGQEGLYRFDLEAGGAGWSMRTIIEHEVSEVVVLDLDGDGVDELITIEPFHGNRLIVYRRDRGSERLAPAFEASLEYGHGLWAGLLGTAARGAGGNATGGTAAGDRSAGGKNRTGKRPALVVGNRAGTRNLDVFTVNSAGDGLDRFTVDPGAGSANIAVVEKDGEPWIVTTNQASEEIAAYKVTLD